MKQRLLEHHECEQNISCRSLNFPQMPMKISSFYSFPMSGLRQAMIRLEVQPPVEMPL
jgi:hypothetical protein